MLLTVGLALPVSREQGFHLLRGDVQPLAKIRLLRAERNTNTQSDALYFDRKGQKSSEIIVYYSVAMYEAYLAQKSILKPRSFLLVNAANPNELEPVVKSPLENLSRTCKIPDCLNSPNSESAVCDRMS